MSIVADAADCADGVMQLVLAYGRYPDGARSEPPLAAEGNFSRPVSARGLFASQSDWCRPAKGPMRFPSIVLGRP